MWDIKQILIDYEGNGANYHCRGDLGATIIPSRKYYGYSAGIRQVLTLMAIYTWYYDIKIHHTPKTWPKSHEHLHDKLRIVGTLAQTKDKRGISIIFRRLALFRLALFLTLAHLIHHINQSSNLGTSFWQNRIAGWRRRSSLSPWWLHRGYWWWRWWWWRGGGGGRRWGGEVQWGSITIINIAIIMIIILQKRKE